MTAGSTANPSPSAPKPPVGTAGYSVVTSVDVAYLSLDPTIDTAATAPACTVGKLEDKGYDHGYGKHEIPVMVTTGPPSSRAGPGTPRNGVLLTHIPPWGG